MPHVITLCSHSQRPTKTSNPNCPTNRSDRKQRRPDARLESSGSVLSSSIPTILLHLLLPIKDNKSAFVNWHIARSPDQTHRLIAGVWYPYKLANTRGIFQKSSLVHTLRLNLFTYPCELLCRLQLSLLILSPGWKLLLRKNPRASGHQRFGESPFVQLD